MHLHEALQLPVAIEWNRHGASSWQTCNNSASGTVEQAKPITEDRRKCVLNVEIGSNVEGQRAKGKTLSVANFRKTPRGGPNNPRMKI
jgi:hypothetical protein